MILKKKFISSSREGSKKVEGDQVLKLKKSFYGLKQSGNKWSKCINNVLVNTLKCKRMITESCIYKRGSDENNNLIILALYVDDIILFANNQSDIDKIKEEINEEFEIDNIGECKKVIGMTVERGVNGSIKLSQKQLIKELLGDFGMNECNSTKSPLETVRLERCDGKCGEEERTDGTKYRSCVGKLNYLASTTRSDLSFAVSYLSQNNKCLHREHMVSAKRVLRYLKGTEDRGVEYTQNSKDIEVYSDADYANDTEDSRSCTGSIVKMEDQLPGKVKSSRQSH